MTESLPIYTIGHSHHEPEEFATLLRQYQISLLVDIRTTPYSRWAPQFNQPLLRQLLRKLGIRYSHAGETLGGGPPDPTIYSRKPADYRQRHRREWGPPDHDAILQRDWFRAGIERLLELTAGEEARGGRLVVCCAEYDPRECHRHLVIARALLTEDPRFRATEQPVRILHILRDGQLETVHPAEFSTQHPLGI